MLSTPIIVTETIRECKLLLEEGCSVGNTTVVTSAYKIILATLRCHVGTSPHLQGSIEIWQDEYDAFLSDPENHMANY